MADLYQKVRDWGRKTGGYLSDYQVRELLVLLGLEADPADICEMTVTRETWASEQMVQRSANDAEWLTNAVWRAALATRRLPLELPQVTEETWEESGVPLIKITARMRARRAD